MLPLSLLTFSNVLQSCLHMKLANFSAEFEETIRCPIINKCYLVNVNALTNFAISLA